jgi:4-hydroxy-tetrahydrodipicolinate reductase
MGREVVRAVTESPDTVVVAEVDQGDDLGDAIERTAPDVIVDFTVPSVVKANIGIAIRARVPVVVGTTGLTADDRADIAALCRETGTGCLIAPNFAIGAVLMMRFAEEAAKYMPDVEVIEMHHEKKVDSPSGTAMLTAELIAAARESAPAPLPAETIEKAPGARGGVVRDVPVHSVRLPGFVASQMVIFGAAGQTLTIRHDSIDRASFMPGVLLAIRRRDRFATTGDLVYGLENLL